MAASSTPRHTEERPSHAWRQKMAGGAAAYTLSLTVPGRLLNYDHILRTDPMMSYTSSKVAWCGVRLADPLLCAALVRKHTRQARRQSSSRSAVLVAMAAVSGGRHAFWALAMLKKPWPLWSHSLPVALFNSFLNWCHCRVSLEREDEHGEESLGGLACVGIVAFMLGSYLETASEVQRAAFKAKPSNAGKPCTTGLWRHAAHINYLGYAMWRTAIGMVSAPPWSLGYGVAMLLDFRLRAVPLLRQHMHAKYGRAWDDYAARTAIFVPGVV